MSNHKRYRIKLTSDKRQRFQEIIKGRWGKVKIAVIVAARAGGDLPQVLTRLRGRAVSLQSARRTRYQSDEDGRRVKSAAVRLGKLEPRRGRKRCLGAWLWQSGGSETWWQPSFRGDPVMAFAGSRRAVNPSLAATS
jgi:hypothetical protein